VDPNQTLVNKQLYIAFTYKICNGYLKHFDAKTLVQFLMEIVRREAAISKLIVCRAAAMT
jgi:hypothetical protein